jgi:hypothetical protein
MKIEPGHYCPLLKKDCIQTKCAWFIQLRGQHPQTGQDLDEWGCAVAWNPILQIETAQQSRQAGAAVESFRNEMVKANETNQKVLMATSQMFVQQADIKLLDNSEK